jgi:hypothetical protein
MYVQCMQVLLIAIGSTTIKICVNVYENTKYKNSMYK